MRTHTHTHLHTCINTHSCAHAHTRVCMHTHTHAHARTHARARTHTCSVTLCLCLMHTVTHVGTCVRGCRHACTLALTHTHTHTHESSSKDMKWQRCQKCLIKKHIELKGICFWVLLRISRKRKTRQCFVTAAVASIVLFDSVGPKHCATFSFCDSLCARHTLGW